MRTVYRHTTDRFEMTAARGIIWHDKDVYGVDLPVRKRCHKKKKDLKEAIFITAENEKSYAKCAKKRNGNVAFEIRHL